MFNMIIEVSTLKRMDSQYIKRKRHIQGEDYSKGSSTYYDPDNSQCKIYILISI